MEKFRVFDIEKSVNGKIKGQKYADLLFWYQKSIHYELIPPKRYVNLAISLHVLVYLTAKLSSKKTLARQVDSAS